MMRPPSLGSTPVPDSGGTAELQHIADMLGWAIAANGVLSLILLLLVWWLVFGRPTSQPT